VPSDFSHVEEAFEDCFNPESGELMLGDIILSVDKIREQAESYGHSQTRELAFLVAHSMLHLCGYDHMEPEEAALMVKDGDTVSTGGFVSCACPEALTKALEQRFVETGHPRDLTLFFAAGFTIMLALDVVLG